MLAHYHEYVYYYKGTRLKIFLYTLYNHFCTELTMTNKKRGHSNTILLFPNQIDCLPILDSTTMIPCVRLDMVGEQ